MAVDGGVADVVGVDCFNLIGWIIWVRVPNDNLDSVVLVYLNYVLVVSLSLL